MYNRLHLTFLYASPVILKIRDNSHCLTNSIENIILLIEIQENMN